jgi:predicted AAA+ superfamily ATPase
MPDEKEPVPVIIEEWASFLRSLVQTKHCYSFYITVAFLTLTDDNPFTHAAEAQEPGTMPPLLRTLAQTDLSRLGRIAGFDLPGLGFHIAERLRRAGLHLSAGNVEEEARSLWAAEGMQDLSEEARTVLNIFPEARDWGASLPEFCAYLHTKGAGELGLYHSFRWTGVLQPVCNPDRVRPADLAGYEEQRQVVVANTLRFLESGYANNLLLYGDRGTGKSATVKAVCNEYAHQGLRLLEVSKRDLFQLPLILESVASRPFRFIIFIDDLSFESTDDSFTSLKMLLEGGVEAKPAHAVVYATSNRRHLVKEPLKDRPTTALAADAAAAGDMRAFDTMQEQFSLADRFGLTVVFTAPGQDEFLHIAEYIAARRGLLKTPEEPEERKRFRENALCWERWFNGRSPRTAAQYVDWAAGGTGFPWEN